MRVRVVYGTQTGNSRSIAQQITSTLVEHGFESECACLDQFKKLKLEEERYLVVVCSTTGNGDPPENAEAFVRFIKRKTQPTDLLARVQYAVLGIGDTNYDQYQAIPRLIDTHLARLGARKIIDRAEADEGTGLLEATVEPFIAGLIGVLESARDGGDADAVARADGAALNGATEAASAVAAGAGAAAGASGPTAAPQSADANADADDDDDGDAVLAWTQAEGGSAQHAHAARVCDATWLTFDDDGRRVMSLAFDISECPSDVLRGYEAGDSIAVLPTNPPEQVAAVLAALGLGDGDGADAPLRPPPGVDVPAHLRADGLTARLALSRHVDLGSSAGWPRPPLLRLLAEHARAPADARALHELATNRSGQLAAERPWLSELLALFPSSRPPVWALVDALPPLAERSYSIASSPLESPTTIRVAFSLVTYRTPVPDTDVGGRAGGNGRSMPPRTRERVGLCSGMLARLGEAYMAAARSGAPGAKAAVPRVRVYRRRPTGNELRLPKSLSTPILMVGPGTGVSPFVGFLRHRRALLGREGATSASCAEAHLFFGCQHRVGDFLFEKELRALEADGALTKLHAAFSRDAIDSASAGEWRNVRINVNYVQDLFFASAPAICELLLKHGAHVYVCGDGRSMASDVHTELLAVLRAEAGLSTPEAERKLAELAAAGRYTREIWYG